MEYHGANEGAVLQTIEEKLRRNTRLVLEDAARRKILPREASVELALARVKKAMSYRRYACSQQRRGLYNGTVRGAHCS